MQQGLLLILALLTLPALAGLSLQPPVIVSPPISFPDIPREEPTAQTTISDSMADKSRRWVAAHLDTLSGGIDSFFVDTFFNEDLTDIDSVGSKARISFFTRREFGDPVDYKFGISVNLELPHTNRRLNLLLESEDDDVRESDPLESPENSTYSAALRFILSQSEQWTTNIDTGVKWAVPPDPFTRLRARRNVYMDLWNIRFTQELSYYTSKGYGESTQLRFDYPTSIRQLLRFETKASYLLNDDFFKLSYGGGLYQEINHTYAYAVLGIARGDTEFGPTFDEYEFGVRVRRRVYKDWMFAEFHPQYIWTRENNWKPTPVLMFRIQAEFSQ